MRLVNCPYCRVAFDGPRPILFGKCCFCHGRRKVNAEYLKWLKKKDEVCRKKDLALIKQKQADLKAFLDGWIEKNPAPRKFRKKT